MLFKVVRNQQYQGQEKYPFSNDNNAETSRTFNRWNDFDVNPYFFKSKIIQDNKHFGNLIN